jgi:hypothetical protein
VQRVSNPRWGALTLIVGALVGLAGCTNTVDSKDVEKKTDASLTRQYGQRIRTKCPGKLEAKKGRSYECAVTAADGSKGTTRIKMLDGSGKFSIAPVKARPTR